MVGPNVRGSDRETHHFQAIMKQRHSSQIWPDPVRSSQIVRSSHTMTAGYAGALGASDVYGSKPMFHKDLERN